MNFIISITFLDKDGNRLFFTRFEDDKTRIANSVGRKLKELEGSNRNLEWKSVEISAERIA